MIAEEGSHEYKVWDAVRKAGRLSLKDPVLSSPSAKLGQGNAFKLKWVKKDGDALVSLTDSAKDTTREQLQYAHDHKTFEDAKVQKEYLKRKLVTTQKVISYAARKGPRWALEMPIEVTDLTAEMLADGSWATANFKPYNFKAKPVVTETGGSVGALHPLMKVREEFRRIFFNMGFEEMPTAR